MNNSDLHLLAGQLGVSLDSLERLGITRNGNAWRTPERNAAGEVIGRALRYDDGRKSFEPGGHRGLTLVWPLDAYAGSSADDPLLIVEGMSDVAAGMDLGFATIGRPSTAGGSEHLRPLVKDRHVCIVGENDGKGADDPKRPGKTGAERIAQGLVGVAASVKIIYPPAEVKDLREWFTAPSPVTRDELLAAIRAAEPIKAEPVPTAESSPERHKDQPSQAEQLVRLALELYRFGRTDTDEPFAVACGGANVALMFRGSRDALRCTLAREFRRRGGTTPNASALADALTTLQGEALDAAPEPVHLRVAEQDGGVVIDLGDTAGRAIVVRSTGWDVVDASPVLFRRSALTGALPVPQRGGKLDDLRELLNVGADAWFMLRGWLVASLLPSIPHPILLLGGEQGAGKSTAARMVVNLFDPSPAPLRSEPRDPEAWAVAAAGSWGVVVDNVSGIPGWFSDALCRAVTGDGWVRRRLYTDGDLALLAFRRVVALTSIDPGALRGDLGDRLLLIDLEAIPPSKRLSETDLTSSTAKVSRSSWGRCSTYWRTCWESCRKFGRPTRRAWPTLAASWQRWTTWTVRMVAPWISTWPNGGALRRTWLTPIQ